MNIYIYFNLLIIYKFEITSFLNQNIALINFTKKKKKKKNINKSVSK